MYPDWPPTPLGQVCLKIGSGTTPRGGANVYVEDGPRFIRSQNVHDLRFDFHGLAHLDDAAAEQLRGAAVQAEDVLINITGDSVARVCLAPNDGCEARVSQHVAIIRPDSTRVASRFLTYWLVSLPVKTYLLTLASAGATRKALTKRMLCTLEFPLPPIEAQNRILSILATVDDKIDSNRRLASLLEETAATIFRSRFVEFVDVEEFQKSDIGEIPCGWRVGEVREICRLKYGKALKASDREPGTVAVVGSSGVVGQHVQPLVQGPVVVIGRKGIPGSVIWIRGDAWPIDTTFFAESVGGVDAIFVYFFLRQVGFPRLTADSAVPGLNRNAAEEQLMAIPTPEAILEFTSIANPLFRKKDLLREELTTLAAIRDTLLPKLISGEIRVPDTNDPEEIIGSAAEQLAQAAT